MENNKAAIANTPEEITACAESHAIALAESGIAENGENYMTLAAYRDANRRELEKRGFAYLLA
jgi:hypothetical protein